MILCGESLVFLLTESVILGARILAFEILLQFDKLLYNTLVLVISVSSSYSENNIYIYICFYYIYFIYYIYLTYIWNRIIMSGI